jgi:hypothetical protein
MKTCLRRMVSVGALGLALTLSSCVYPYNYAGSYQPRSTLYGSIGGGPLGSFAGSRLATNRGQSYNGYNSRYFSVRGAPLYSSRGYTPYRSSYSPYRYSSYTRGYGYSPYRYSSYSRGYGYSPYSYGYSPFSGGFSPFSGIVLSNYSSPSYGYGRGWGYGSSCW